MKPATRPVFFDLAISEWLANTSVVIGVLQHEDICRKTTGGV